MLQRILVVLLMASLPCFAQKVRLLQGDLKPLKGQKSIQIEFEFDSILIGGVTPEAEYIANKKNLWEQKEPGKGEDFESMWFDSRSDMHEPTFAFWFSKATGWSTKDPSAPFKMIVKTRQIEPGWTIGIIDHQSSFTGEALIVNVNDGRPIARLLLMNMRSRDAPSGDFQFGKVIQQAYKTGGEITGAFILKALRR
jgi:hypothetical protein